MYPGRDFHPETAQLAYETCMIRKAIEPTAALAQLWPDLPETERMTFVALTPARQQMALTRLKAVQDFQSGFRSPAELMQRVELGRTQFYKLLRDWKASKSLASLVPHAGSSRARTPKIDPRIAEICEEVLLEYAGKPPEEVPSETVIMREVQARVADEKLIVPADLTVRRVIARLSLADPAIQLSAIARGQRSGLSGPRRLKEAEDEIPDHLKLEFTQVFGGQLLVDHSTLDMIVAESELKMRPTVSLVVDSATRLILAARLIDHIPRVEDFLNILALSAGGYQRFRQKGLSAVAGLHPVLTMRNGLSKEWSELRTLAKASGFKFDIRRAPEPVFGHILRRSMVTHIGNLQLLPRSTMLEPVHRIRSNDAHRAIIGWGDAAVLLEKAVAAHNAERLLAAPDEILSGTGWGTRLRLDTDRKDWLEYGLSIFREAWARRLS